MQGAISDTQKPIFSRHHTRLSAEAGLWLNLMQEKKKNLIPTSAIGHSGIDALKNTLENTAHKWPMHCLRCWLIWGPWEVRPHTLGADHCHDNISPHQLRGGGTGREQHTQSWAKGRQPHPNLQGEINHSYPDSYSFPNPSNQR